MAEASDFASAVKGVGSDKTLGPRIASIARSRRPSLMGPDEFGKFAELVVCAMFSYTPWLDLPHALRLSLNGGKASCDMGIDAVGKDGTLVQVKWFQPGRSVGTTAIRKLTSMADDIRKLGVCPAVRCVFVLQEGTHISRSCPDIQREQIEVMYVSREEVDAYVAKMTEQFTNDIAIGQAAPAEYERFQAECAEVLWNAGDSLPRPIRAKLPTGVGKSYIIARLAAMHTDEDDWTIILEPRIAIIREMATMLRDRGMDVHTVFDGTAWEDGHKVYIVSGSSVKAIPDNVEATAVIIDEAHYALGHCVLDRIRYGVRYELSASLEGKDFDYEMRYEDAIARKFICDVRYVFAAFSAAPEFRDVAAHLVEHPEHRCVLACFQEKKSAREFVRVYNELDPGQACEFTSDQKEFKNLDAFKDGKIRVLAVVTRVEMGVNVHRVDTVLLAEPWDS
ncbi:MAG: hypothetical protein KGL39_35415, partial [Patescibacteria group bacterium]|nr:hypothetical protein [Patescibacteria group bacterium]